MLVNPVVIICCGFVGYFLLFPRCTISRGYLSFSVVSLKKGVTEFGKRHGKEQGTSREAVSAVLVLVVQQMIIRFPCVNKNAGEHLS